MEVVEGVIWKHRRKKRALHEGWMEALLLFFFSSFLWKTPCSVNAFEATFTC